MKLFSFALLCLSLACVAQTKPEGEVSPSVKSAAIDAAGCLSALEDTTSQRASLYEAQKTRCEESLKKLDLLAESDAERKIYGSLTLLKFHLNSCRTWWTVNNLEQYRKCMAQARAQREEAEDKIKPKPRAETSEPAAPPSQSSRK